MSFISIQYSSRALVLSDHSARSDSGQKRRHLIVSDLHIGFEEKFRLSGVSLESNVEALSSELSEIISNQKITDLVIIGDVKSSTDRISKSEWENVPKLFSKLPANCKVIVVPGNHDGSLNHLVPNTVEIADVGGLLIGGNLLMHGHTKPLSKFAESKRIIIGHLHPIFQERGNPMAGQPVWIFLKIRKKRVFEDWIDNETDSQLSSDSLLEVIVMPSFNRDLVIAGFAREAARQERRVAPILRVLKEAEEALVVTLRGEIIGETSLLRRIL